MESRSNLLFTRNGDVPAHENAETTGNRESQAGSAVAPRGRALTLGKRIKELIQILRSYPDSGIRNRERNGAFVSVQ